MNQLNESAERIEECFEEIIERLRQDFGGDKGKLEHNVWKLEQRMDIIREYVESVLNRQQH